MSIDIATVKKAAGLARIKIDEETAERMTQQLNKILKMVEQLADVNTDNVEPLSNVMATKLKLRKDAVTDGGVPEKVLKNAPEETQGYFVVPKVVE